MAPLAIQGQHQLAPQAFPQRVLGKQDLDLPDRPRVGAAGQQRINATLLCSEPRLVEPSGLREQRGLIPDEVSQRGTSPQRQRVFEESNRGARIRRQHLPSFAHERLETGNVQFRRIDPQAIAGGRPPDPVVADGLAETQHVGLDDLARCLGRFFSPDLVQQGLGGHDLVRPDQQMSQHRALLRPTERKRTATGVDLEWSQQPELHPSWGRRSLGVCRTSGNAARPVHLREYRPSGFGSPDGFVLGPPDHVDHPRARR